jgi:hypothetical protein
MQQRATNNHHETRERLRKLSRRVAAIGRRYETTGAAWPALRDLLAVQSDLDHLTKRYVFTEFREAVHRAPRAERTRRLAIQAFKLLNRA